jgi:cytosine/adenosine deaminase-related metal-dependent hydrolase
MIFSNATIITMDQKRRIITHGALFIINNLISDIGKTADIVAKYPGEKKIDCNGNVILPGLIDTHVHTAQAMIRGCADDLRLLDWLFKRVWVLQGNYSNADGKASAALCALEHIKSGTTSFIECMLAERYGIDGVVETLIQSGMRSAVGKIVMDRPSYAESEMQMYPGMVEDAETGINNTLKAYDRWNGAGNDRIHIWFGPRTPGGVTSAIYNEISRLAKEREMGITIHLSEIREDNSYAKSQGFRSATEFALAHGLLGPKTVLAHFVWSDEADWKFVGGNKNKCFP